MTSTAFPHLFSPLVIGGVTLKNRVLSSGHDTVLVEGGQVTDDLVAYHEARAEGGVGLIVVQVAGVHETARYTTHVLMATDDSCVEGCRMARRGRAPARCQGLRTALPPGTRDPGVARRLRARRLVGVGDAQRALPCDAARHDRDRDT